MLTAILTVAVASSMVGCGSKTKEDVSDLQINIPDTAPELAQNQEEEVEEVSNPVMDVMVSVDPAFMGLASFEEKVDNGIIYVNEYNVTKHDSVEPIVKAVSSSTETEFATIPIDAALKLYNAGVDINVLSIINTGGVYLTQNGTTVNSMQDLAGKTIYSLGEHSSNETQIKYILAENGVDVSGITFEYVASYDEALQNENAIIVMTEPYVTQNMSNNENMSICLDLESEWNKIQEANDVPAPFITSVLVSNSSFIEEYPHLIREFLMFAHTSVNALNIGVGEGLNPLESYDISLEAIANTGVTYIAGEDMVYFAGAYLYVLDEYDGEFLGGELPGDEFYYWG